MRGALGFCRLCILARLLRVGFNQKLILTPFIMATVVCFLLGGTDVKASDAVILNCVETPEIKNVVPVPKRFNLSSNLLKHTGHGSDRNVIHIVGRVTDAYCRPISGANVFIWHSDSNGRYADDTGYDRGFHGSGKATTDNLGNYGFTTILPGSSKGRSPLVHFLVKHNAFPGLQTEMFFEGMEDGYDGYELSRIPGSIKKLLTARYIGSEHGIGIYEFNITFSDDAI
ncbi:dioxygenase family protein [Anaplasma bovis]|uniref:dioxygenase family protein n=1 Tax=Anaplasma bovis TaxID=186733 RepID=UPI002FF0F41A